MSLANQQTISTIFMVEPGPLEAQAHLLIHSLIINCLDDFQMIAYCRAHLADKLQPETIELLDSKGVQLVQIESPFEEAYGAGNKIVIAGLERETDWTVILDTDTFLARPSRFLSQAAKDCICVRPETRNAWSENDEVWASLFGIFDLERPPKNVTLTYGAVSYPFFNAGMVMFSGNQFGSVWMDTCLAIDASDRIRKKRPWLDQISLPVAIERTKGQSLKIVDEGWNDSADVATENTALLHYHRPRRLIVTGNMPLADAIMKQSGSEYKNFLQVVHAYKNTGVNLFSKAINFDK
jgi:hypothetical protein